MMKHGFHRVVLGVFCGLTCLWLTLRTSSNFLLPAIDTTNLLVRTISQTHPAAFRVDVRRLGIASDDSIDIDKAKTITGQLLSLIYRRYELDSRPGGQFWRTSNNIDVRTWEILKYKIATKMVEGNGEFLMIFGGSSVTAGHDNFYNQSYPAIFNKRMKDIFAALGIKLTVRNIALGANNCVPYIFCYESMGGLNPDFVNWEQSYNCGRDNGVFEAAARIVGLSSNRPGVVYYSASGAWSPRSCPPSSDKIPYSSEDWTPAVAQIAEWIATEDAVSTEKDLLLKFNEAKSSSFRFSGNIYNDYKGVGMFGFNVWEQNRLCQFTNPKSGKIESCNGIDAAEGCTMKFMTQEAGQYGSLDGRGANWHPTRAFHMLRGEAIVWIFSLIIHEMLTMYQQDLLTKSRKDILDEYAKKLASHRVSVPSPKYCGGGSHCDRKPVCFTDFRPHYSRNMTLAELVVGETKWNYDPVDLNSWSLTYGYLDAKPIYTAKSADNGELHIKFSVKKDNDIIWLCGQIQQSLAHAKFFLDLHQDDATKKKYIPTPDRKEWTKKKYVGAECKELSDIPKGTHVVSVINGGDKGIEISHLITWEP